jgi:hypothetical protein
MGANRTEIFNVTRLTAPLTYGIKSGDDMINIDTSSGALSLIYLPNISQNGLNLVGKTYTINDISNNASIGSITITCLGGDTINNAPSITLNVDGVSANIVQVDRTRWLATTNVSSGVLPTPLLIPITYADLVNFIGAGTLVAGQQYLLTDYETIYDQPDFDALGLPKAVVTTNTGAVEPLILRAVSQFEISGMVQSVVFPFDKIQYDWTFSATEVMGAPAKGRIIERVSGNYLGTENNRASYDHREVVFKRYETFAGSGVFTVINDNGEAFDGNILTFGKCVNMYLGNISSGSGFPFLLSNNIFGVDCYDVTIGIDCWNNTFGSNCYGISFGLSCRNNTIGSNFNNNTIGDYFDTNIIPDGFTNNSIGNNFVGNTTGVDFSSNSIGNFFANNTIGDFFENQNIGNIFSGNNIGINSSGNTIGNDFQTNTIGDNFSNNSIGNTFNNNGISFAFENNTIGNIFGENTIDFGFSSNTIGDFFRLNIVGNKFANNNFGVSCQSNNIGNASTNNNIGNAFTSNTIGGGFGYNVISADFNSNITVANFQQNNICKRITMVDFTLATHVYGNYDCNIVRSSTGVFYLIYFNGIASVSVTPINS